MYSSILLLSLAGAPDVPEFFAARSGCSGVALQARSRVVVRTTVRERVQLFQPRSGCVGTSQSAVRTGCHGIPSGVTSGGFVNPIPSAPAVPPAVMPPPMPPMAPQTKKITTTTTTTVKTETTVDALTEVNAKRVQIGLRPLIRDDGLVRAAAGAAAFRASRLLFGHTSNDFVFIPAGTTARAAGCAAYAPGYGWMSCCVDDRSATYGGAAYVMGADGKRYMHLFVR